MWPLFSMFLESNDENNRTEKLVNAMAVEEKNCSAVYFKMPVDYPRYTKADYQAMGEDTLDRLLKQYGLLIEGTLNHKREFAIGAFLWPDQILAQQQEDQKREAKLF